MQQSIKQAHPAKDIWALACVISEAAVWTVFGQKGLDRYHRLRVEATNDEPTLRNTGYSGCFHNTRSVLSAVDQIHKEATQSRRANIDNIVGSVLVTVGGMMMQDPARRPDAWRVYEDLKRAIELATPTVHAVPTQPPVQPPAQDHHIRHSMPVNFSPTLTNGVGLGVDPLSLQSPSVIQGQSHHLLERRSTINGLPSHPPPSGATSSGKGKAPMRSPYSPASRTTHGPQRTPLPPLPSPIPEYRTPFSSSTRPKASIMEVLEYIPKKKTWPHTILPGEESLKRLGGRDQVFHHA